MDLDWKGIEQNLMAEFYMNNFDIRGILEWGKLNSFYSQINTLCLSIIFCSILSHNIARYLGTIDDFATIPFYLALFSAALVELEIKSPSLSTT